MKFSVVIPLYNKADVIARTLQSVADQIFRDYELIVVDDGSTDGSADMVEEFARTDRWRSCNCILRLVRQENAGVSAARNRGVREAVGQYVAFLDGDDIWLPQHLMDLYEVCRTHPEAKVLSTNEGCYIDGRVYLPRSATEKIGCMNIFDYPGGGYPLHSSTVAIDRMYFLSVGGYNEKMSFYEDRELYYRMAEDIGDFHVNWRVSAYYSKDAKEALTRKGVRSFADYGYLQTAERMMQEGVASERLRRCVAKSADYLLRGAIMRNRWTRVASFAKAFPNVLMAIPAFRMCGSSTLSRPFVWLYIGMECFCDRLMGLIDRWSGRKKG